MNRTSLFLALILSVSSKWFAGAFLPVSLLSQPIKSSIRTYATLSDGSMNGSDLVARRIIVTGDVNGGYYRSCVKNEASRFRKLVGTMTPPDDSKEAEIYVEGKAHMVDGFVRWCKRGNVGLSQVISVRDVIEEEPTGLYDAFYVKVDE
ncbi:Acylphosphatase [Fragilaria crotonensis]|nr:Acylphosphatase [Fragilaria crotonensis]